MELRRYQKALLHLEKAFFDSRIFNKQGRIYEMHSMSGFFALVCIYKPMKRGVLCSE